MASGKYSKGSGLVGSLRLLDGLALDTHFGDHRTDDTDADAIGDLGFEFVVIDHLGDFADETTAQDHLIAPADVLQDFVALLGLLALRTENQEVEDDDHRQ